MGKRIITDIIKQLLKKILRIVENNNRQWQKYKSKIPLAIKVQKVYQLCNSETLAMLNIY